MLTAREVKPDIWWVGGIDWNERMFHGYTTEAGITYNAYLIMDEKITLIDTVKPKFADELIQRISQIVDPSKIDVVITNHVEMDHSGALPRIHEIAPQAQIYASNPQGVKGIAAHYGIEAIGVKTGDSISIGRRTLTFVQTPMVHWPDNMVTYCPEDKILFSNDAFGQHFASSKRFDVENDMSEVMHQARKYYANIVQPYSMQASKALEVVKGLDLEVIAPSHGVIWTEHIPDILAAYEDFTSGKVEEKALIVYDSMWESTAKMAKAICEAFIEEGVPAQYVDLKRRHESDIMTEFLDAKYICIGSPTLNSQMLPTVAGFLTYMRGLSPKNDQRVGLAFGSYGWAPLGPKNVGKVLEECGFQLPVDTLTQNWIPSQEVLDGIQQTVRTMIENAQ
ncbi:MAG TPA: FprA family A-type flavoprotein [Candidatus Coprovicinus avistercoris]|uniref:FprA family A-type flavoprotein n=1 Tax=Candidatus Coprovicinus avistercoris TaxID=2840754 RepID=A0A9D1HW24_9ACTN|nr:FprA family A-type flavoprotein [Candidatus Coprovicinus avistercoris]